MKTKEFEKCLERGKIKIFSRAKQLVSKELDLAKQDLKSSEKSFLGKNYRWATIQAYYSMFHTARALIYQRGYREKSHFCLAEALKSFYVSENILPSRFLEALQLGKSLRENADYYGDFDKAGTESMLESAKDFLRETKKILKK
ncbi:MAG: HEPN domain-containing protein [Parcubacteria group bacterium]